MNERVAPLEEIADRIVKSGAISVRDVDAGEDPFVYSTGNRGPGYVMIKGLVGQPRVMKFLVKELAKLVAPHYGQDFNFIEGNATGGMIPAWQLADDVEKILDIEEGSIPRPYLRESRKAGGHSELITGTGNNKILVPGMRALVVEELVNYAGTTTNAALIFREAGFPVTHAACILTYDHSESNAKLRETGVDLISLIRLPQLLDALESTGLVPKDNINSYRNFLADPLKWQLDRKLVIPEDSARRAIERGIPMIELAREEALRRGAPANKLDKIVYWAPQNEHW